jgi:hypothetical protein
MSKKIMAYCGVDSVSGYVQWGKAYLGLTEPQRVKFLEDILGRLEHERQFRVRLIDTLKTSSEGQELPQ